MSDLLAARFPGQYLLLRPGSTARVQLPQSRIDEFAQAAAGRGAYPHGLPGLARECWRVELPPVGPMDRPTRRWRSARLSSAGIHGEVGRGIFGLSANGQ